YRVIYTTLGIKKLLVSLYFFDVDYTVNPYDGWAWHSALREINPVPDYEIQESKIRFVNYYHLLPKYEYSLILGTGPSLIKARQLTHLDCYKIACNTIVKDHKLWTQLKLHFLVAGDAIYHFGHNQYAASFRRDLKLCLKLHEVLFLYPALYHPFIKVEFQEFSHLLVPVPEGDSDQLNNDLLNNFYLPVLGNVLNLLLLPLATSLTKKNYLLGFDGRAPQDILFWSNSSDHSYAEHIPDIQKKHPRFFDYFIDNKNPFKYVNSVHGDVLDNNLTLLEKQGYEFIVLAPSYTNTFQKRYKALFNLD
ncbi:MAG TPA: hypothetical protein VK616_02230, partial [Flavitalea sp.]|nr:hypothetical protein [Flavitalea sp.]